jgi:hypothetical protein
MTLTDADTTAPGSGEESTPGPGGPGRVIPWIRTHPGMVVALLIPVVAVVGPQLFGFSYLNGDNYIQNLPMRALVGSDLDHGIVPLWNPYLFSGTPLLGGFNAGAAYPVTWLTAVLPLFTAWSVNLIVTYELALVGMYLFLRRQALGTFAATLGAVTFAFAGYMTGQMVHIDLIGGASWLPWMLMAVHGLTTATAGDGGVQEAGAGGVRQRTWTWALVLAVSLGLVFLTGNSEATIDSAVLVVIYGIGRLVTGGLLRRGSRRALIRSLAGAAAGVVGGVALGAAQWLPGLLFLSQSQRGTVGYSFFSSGSLDNRLVSLVVSPFVLGTAQNVPAGYAGSYNFPEVTSYVGVVALIAACSLFLRRWRTGPDARQWWVWYVVLVVGVLSALGGDTPFGHLMYAVPGIKSERLLNRNILLVDCALAVLTAWFVHGLMADRQARGPEPSTLSRLWRRGGRAEVVVTAAPLALMAAVCLLLWVDGAGLQRALDISHPMTTFVRDRVAVLVTVQVAVAAWVTWVVLVRRRFTARTFGRLLGAAVAVDLVLFNVFVIAPPIREAQAMAAGPTSAAFRSLVGDGRFIIYDPDEFDDSQLLGLGQTDLNLYQRLPSAQGYTALVDGTYYGVTGAHYQEDLNPESLAGPVWEELNVTTLLSLPGYFVTPVPSGPGPVPGSGPGIQYPNDLYHPGPLPQPDTVTLAGRSDRTWYFGGVLTVSSFQVPVLSGPSALRVGLVTPTGGLRWLPPTAAAVSVATVAGQRTVRVSLARPAPAGGIVVGTTGSRGAVLGVPDAVTAQSGEVALDGRMQFGTTAPQWTFAGMFGSFGVFRPARPLGWARVTGPTGGAAPAGSSTQASAPGLGGGGTVSVHATGPAALVRSVAFAEGWHATVATVEHRGGGTTVGPARPAAVTRAGLAQQVALPAAGDYLVTFSYAPTDAVVGLVVSAVAVVGLGVAAVCVLVSARRRRRARRMVPGTTGC